MFHVSGWRCIAVYDDALAHFSPDEAKAVPPAAAVVLGRGHTAPAFRHITLGHRYCSRRQLTVEVVKGESPPVLRLTQLGRNPTFYGPGAAKLEQGGPAVHLAGAAAVLPRGVEMLSSRPELPGSVFFPNGLGLPTIHFFYVPPQGAPAVPTLLATPPPVEAPPTATGTIDLGVLDNMADSDDDETPPPAMRRTGPSVLDAAMREHHRGQQRETLRAQLAARYVAPPAVAAAAVPAPASVGVKPAIKQEARATASAPAAAPKVPAAVWEWKSRPDGSDSDPRSWRAYSPADQATLEQAFSTDGGRAATVPLSSVYSVCFADASHGMLQFRADDPTRWRSVRRRGGLPVARPQATRVRVVPGHSGSDSSHVGSGDDYDRNDSFINDDDEEAEDEGSDESSFSFDAESSSSSDGSRRRKKKKNMKKQKAKYEAKK